ncbi:helix-turn-helix domain-containing protein [Cohnella silvisoli]|uniref:helix-turn-helix domain-containing protein n=1 Tax=Cohnella silvisoli TaxID=2873699 RepID=UPI00359FBE0F|nr:helix-turn-helix domain-containing protein [Cohnella silvisoli]
MIGYRISKLRTENRLSLDKMVTATGIERSILISFELDESKPSDGQLASIANFLNVSLERLLGTDVDLSSCHFHFYGKSTLTDEDYELARDIIRMTREKKRAAISQLK